jgi:hypothetical protein
LSSWRVTKYDPARRDAGGAYQGDDWTAESDIGGTFGGKILTRDDYLRVENAYLAAIAAFLEDSGVTRLQVRNLEAIDEGADASLEGTWVEGEQLLAVARDTLRTRQWCKLEAPGFHVHFGYDYYMYIGSAQPCERAIAAARAAGLFVEPMASPYAT